MARPPQVRVLAMRRADKSALARATAARRSSTSTTTTCTTGASKTPPAATLRDTSLSAKSSLASTGRRRRSSSRGRRSKRVGASVPPAHDGVKRDRAEPRAAPPRGTNTSDATPTSSTGTTPKTPATVTPPALPLELLKPGGGQVRAAICLQCKQCLADLAAPPRRGAVAAAAEGGGSGSTHGNIAPAPPLTNADAVLIMDAWNKVLAFRDRFSEALALRWRLLAAMEEVTTGGGQEAGEGGASAGSNGSAVGTAALAERLVDAGQDPVARALGARVVHLRALLVGMVDACVRELHPATQRVAREAYRSVQADLWEAQRQSADARGVYVGPTLETYGLSEGSLIEYLNIFAHCGVAPQQWVLFCDALVWALHTHSPYADADDRVEHAKAREDNVFARFAAAHVARRAVEAILALHDRFSAPLFTKHIVAVWGRARHGRAGLGKAFCRMLRKGHREVVDYLSDATLDVICAEFANTIDAVVRGMRVVGLPGTSFRMQLDAAGERIRGAGFPPSAFAAFGAVLTDVLRPHCDAVESSTRQDAGPTATATALEDGIKALYDHVVLLAKYPSVVQDALMVEAEDFIAKVAAEAGWAETARARRTREVRAAITASGTYTHTTEELELGARLAWRNSAKCPGRATWDNLIVRDCRDVVTAAGACAEVEQHMALACCGGRVQSVMTVFAPKGADAWGMRFWSSQVVRYAAYKTADGTVMGDPANLEFTDYLVARGLWSPPTPRTHFDRLPLVVCAPGDEKPYVHTLPEGCVWDVPIVHPDYREATRSVRGGLRWAAVPALCNFSLNLGGVEYPCAPFSGWFLSTEIARNLLERFRVGEELAEAMRLHPGRVMARSRVMHELDVAVFHSFRKAGCTIVDPEVLATSFASHMKRERAQGRECPAQWSWIGGLVGPTNPMWHREMRDFYVAPHFEYTADAWQTTNIADAARVAVESARSRRVAVAATIGVGLPVVLIAYGSQTGTAEAAAQKLAKRLAPLRPTLSTLDDVADLSVVAEKGVTHVLVVCSTFNDGDFPSNARVFGAARRRFGCMSMVTYAVLALGSQQYPNFCAAGVAADAILRECGGTSLVEMEKIDTGVSYADDIADWIEMVGVRILPETDGRGVDRCVVDWMTPNTGRARCAPLGDADAADTARCLENIELFAHDDTAERSTRRVVLELPRDMVYTAGDHLAVHPLNPLELVTRFARCFQDELAVAWAGAGAPGGCALSDDWTAQMDVPLAVRVAGGDAHTHAHAHLAFPAGRTLAEILLAHVDLAMDAEVAPSLVGAVWRRVCGTHNGALVDESVFDPEDLRRLRRLKFWAKSIREATCEADRRATIESVAAHYPTVVDFLESHVDFTRAAVLSPVWGSQPPRLGLADVLPLLRRLQPRYYSISSSPAAAPPRVAAITVGVRSAVTPAGKPVRGVASHYLARLRPGDRVRAVVHTSTFRGPPVSWTGPPPPPVLLVSAGTGIAPLMSFLEERVWACQGAVVTAAGASGAKREKDEAKGEEAEAEADASAPPPCLLITGHRSRAEQLYKDVIDAWAAGGVVEHSVALSREPGHPRRYVQDVLRERAAAVCATLLHEEGRYYVCGDARMAAACEEACVELLAQRTGQSRVWAAQRVELMRAEHRWQADVWGVGVVGGRARAEGINIDTESAVVRDEGSASTPRASGAAMQAKGGEVTTPPPSSGSPAVVDRDPGACIAAAPDDPLPLRAGTAGNRVRTRSRDPAPLHTHAHTHTHARVVGGLTGPARTSCKKQPPPADDGVSTRRLLSKTRPRPQRTSSVRRRSEQALQALGTTGRPQGYTAAVAGGA